MATIFELIKNNVNNDVETNFSLEKYTKLWIEGGISNYDYLTILNFLVILQYNS